MNTKLTNGQKQDIANYKKYQQNGGTKTFDQWEKIEAKLKVCRVEFEMAEHWRGRTFEEFLKHIGMENPFEEVEEEARVKEELTPEQKKENQEFEEYLQSGGLKSLPDFKKLGRRNNNEDL